LTDHDENITPAAQLTKTGGTGSPFSLAAGSELAGVGVVLFALEVEVPEIEKIGQTHIL
jgi:hypothetical protein